MDVSIDECRSTYLSVKISFSYQKYSKFYHFVTFKIRNSHKLFLEFILNNYLFIVGANNARSLLVPSVR